jgi:hypothetical protein
VRQQGDEAAATAMGRRALARTSGHQNASIAEIAKASPVSWFSSTNSRSSCPGRRERLKVFTPFGLPAPARRPPLRRIVETLAELPFIGDQVVCLSHDQAARSGWGKAIGEGRSQRCSRMPKRPAAIRRRSASTHGSRPAPAARPSGAMNSVSGSRSG